MLRKKVHVHLSHHKKESSNEEGFISGGLVHIMNKNEKLIMGLLVGGIIIFLAISIMLLFGKGSKDTSITPITTLGPTKKVNLTPYPTIPPIKDMTVMVNERLFNPPTAKIKRGNSILFLNIGQKPMTIEANDANSSILSIGTIEIGEDKIVQFTTAGTYTYRDKENPKKTGTIIIE